MLVFFELESMNVPGAVDGEGGMQKLQPDDLKTGCQTACFFCRVTSRDPVGNAIERPENAKD
jgi:hypothetical protein